MKNEEISILVDENDEIIGYKNRAHLGPTDRMRIVIIWLEDGKGNVLVQKRSMSKKHGAGLWENAAGGAVEKGESYEEAAYKELSEELGLTDIELTFHTKNVFESHHGPKACGWYTGVVKLDESEFNLQTQEVDYVKWVNKNELLAHRTKNPDDYMPSSALWGELFYKRSYSNI